MLDGIVGCLTVSILAFCDGYGMDEWVLTFLPDTGSDVNKASTIKAKARQNEQEFVRPRWPYDMRPSVRAEKYMCIIVIR